jgi:hypothetical protein
LYLRKCTKVKGPSSHKFRCTVFQNFSIIFVSLGNLIHVVEYIRVKKVQKISKNLFRTYPGLSGRIGTFASIAEWFMFVFTQIITKNYSATETKVSIFSLFYKLGNNALYTLYTVNVFK